jgi:diguanylate cyclase (GGDEF)-like protein
MPRLIEMLNERDLVISDNDCPVTQAIANSVQLVRRHTITGRGGKEVQVNAHIIPVLSAQGIKQGATVLLHDMSSETTLEEQIQSLNARATQDALTKVANRAELDRALVKFISSHLDRNLPCSLVLADIDHFKSINDTYGHQAGDEALKTFAAVLKRSCRTGDVVARYGGEEFALLCADCDNASATARAEKIRREIAAVEHDSLGGTSFTSSFGVTEIQQGDSPETMIRRADRALYEAKEMGRNMVVQLGSGLSGASDEKPQSWWQSWFGGGKVGQLLETRLVANVPIKIIVEKLRGFVADQEAEINSADEDHVVLTVDGPTMPLMRRTGDRNVPLSIELTFDQQAAEAAGSVRTRINVVIRPKRGRDRRRSDSVERARQVLCSLKSYLIARELTESDEQRSEAPGEDKTQRALAEARAMLGPWLESRNP